MRVCKGSKSEHESRVSCCFEKGKYLSICIAGCIRNSMSGRKCEVIPLLFQCFIQHYGLRWTIVSSPRYYISIKS